MVPGVGNYHKMAIVFPSIPVDYLMGIWMPAELASTSSCNLLIYK